MMLKAWCGVTCIVCVLVTALLLALLVNQKSHLSSSARLCPDSSSASVLYRDQEPIGSSTARVDQDPSGTSTARVTQDPSGTSTARVDLEPPGSSKARVTQDPSGMSTARMDQELPGTSTTRVTQDPSGTSTARMDQELPGTSTARVDQESPDKSMARVYQEPPSTSTARVDQDPPGKSTARVALEPPGKSTTRVDQEPPSTSMARMDQELPSTSTARVVQETPATSTAYENQKSPITCTARVDQVPPGTSSARVTQDPPITSTARVDQVPPDTSTARVTQDTSSKNRARVDQDPPGTNKSSVDQNLSGVSTVRVIQDPPATTTARANQDPADAGLAPADQNSTGASSTRAYPDSAGASLELKDRELTGAPRCRHPGCQFIMTRDVSDTDWKSYYYAVEGNIIHIRDESSTILLDCNGWRVLESPALPHFEPAHPVQEARLEFCPPPATGSFYDTLATLNISYTEQGTPDKQFHLNLYKFPPKTRLAAKHFVGLERLQYLTIYNKYTRASIQRDLFTTLSSLQTLEITGVTLPASELGALPLSIEALLLHNTGIERLPDAIYSLPKLNWLTIADNIPFDGVSVPAAVTFLSLDSPVTSLQLDVAPALETLDLFNWTEPQPQPLERCDALQRMYLTAPAMRALPDKWLANCTKLVMVQITQACNLITLPPLFSPEVALKSLALTHGILETLQPGVLDDLWALEKLELDDNRLKTLPSDLFNSSIYYKLSHLNLASNDLDSNVWDVVKKLPWKSDSQVPNFKLDLSYNPRIGDACIMNGYSPLGWFSDLRELLLRGTGVSRICTDWRRLTPRLEMLDLRDTKIFNLSFKDLLYTRRVVAQVRLDGSPVSHLHITRQEYNRVRLAGLSFTSLHIDTELECDCSMYWVRRAMERSTTLLALPDISQLRCAGGKLLSDLSPDAMVCPARAECAMATLPPECECTSRPDDDSTQDLWLVRVRCANSAQGLVPRRIYPFYPLYKSSYEGFYLKENVTYL